MSIKKENLNLLFDKAVAIANNMDPLPQDVMLQFYAFYKQATIKSVEDFTFDTMKDRDIKTAFKFNAVMQIKSVSPKKAKQEYIKLVEIYSKQKIK